METNAKFRVVDGNKDVLFVLIKYMEICFKNKRINIEKKAINEKKINDICCPFNEELETSDSLYKLPVYCLIDTKKDDTNESNLAIREAVVQSKKRLSYFENEKLVEVINNLTEKQRLVFCLHYIEGFNFEKIAFIMGNSSRTVKDHAERALEEILLNEKNILGRE